jgi:hypothetical protein
MSLKPIIDNIANQADELLEGVTTRADARAAIAKQLTIRYPRLLGSEWGKVIDGVLSILNDESFFASASGSEKNDLDDDGIDDK